MIMIMIMFIIRAVRARRASKEGWLNQMTLTLTLIIIIIIMFIITITIIIIMLIIRAARARRGKEGRSDQMTPTPSGRLMVAIIR